MHGIGKIMQNHAKKWFENTSANAMAAIAIGAMLIFSVAGMKAFADNLDADSLETNTNSVTIQSGESTDVKYWIVANNGDGQTGCNAATDSSPAKVTINAPSGVQASPGELTFTTCGSTNFQVVQFTSSQVGTHEITASVSDAGAGTYNTNPAKITLTVEAPPAPTDDTAPVITPNIEGTKGSNDWYTSDVKVSWTVEENESPDSLQTTGCDITTISTDTTGTDVTCEATSDGGSSSKTVTIKRDATKPEITVNNGISNGAEFYFGDVPNAPTCDATDATSGVNSNGCQVSGYSTAVGSHTLKFTAKDNAGNTAEEQRSYTVLPWTIKGFYQPVDMNGVLNTVKGGSTVPLKFEVFKGSTELTATSAIVTPLKASKVTCDGSATLDEIEILATGSTGLRYDSTAGQFIYNWQTPKKPGECYNVKVGTQDGSFTDIAEFKLR